MAFAPLKASFSDSISPRSALTIVTPSSSTSCLAAGASGLRVIARTFHPGMLEKVLATDPPYKLSALEVLFFFCFLFFATDLRARGADDGDYLRHDE